MTCFFCKGDMESSVTTHMAELPHCIVIVKNVPCMKCRQCGEAAFSGAVARKLEEILRKCRDLMTEVAIINYNDIAA